MNDQVDSEALLDRWLTERHDAVVHDLAATLNLDAGLRDVTVPARHDRLVKDVRGALDLEAGLTAVRGLLEVEEASESNPNVIIELGDQRLFWRSDSDRLEMRTHTAVPNSATCGCVQVRMAVLDRAYNLVLIILAELNASGISALVSVRLLDELRLNLKRAIDKFDRGFEADLDRFCVLIDKIVLALDVEDASQDVRLLARNLAQELGELERVLNDYTDANLENVNLQGIRLSGVRWSDSTRWPADWADRIQRHSDEIAPGRFVVRDDDLLA